MNGKPWSLSEIAKLRRIFPRKQTKTVARLLRRSVPSIVGAAKKYGIAKDPAYLSPLLRRLGRGLGIAGALFRFRKGHVPFQKGKKGWSAGGRSVETRFKKGHFPANRDPDFYVAGALRVNTDGYIDMRTSFRKGALGWRALHKILWEDAHGPVPKGFALRFKDGDRLNVELANLELVSRADLMRRNTIHNLPPQLKSAINLLGQLKRRIREKQDRGPAQPPVRHA
jgi:hypothetical protein